MVGAVRFEVPSSFLSPQTVKFSFFITVSPLGSEQFPQTQNSVARNWLHLEFVQGEKYVRTSLCFYIVSNYVTRSFF